MPVTNPTYEELLKQVNRLQSENKKLRLRPSIHSDGANILEFMNIKSQMAESALLAKNIDEAIDICLSYLMKISNIHSVSFFRTSLHDKNIELIKEKGLPKKFINDLQKTTTKQENNKYFFPLESSLFYSKDGFGFQDLASIFIHFRKFRSMVINPIIRNSNIAISVMLLSTKEFNEDSYFKVLNQSILAQLKSSFSRILATDNLQLQARELEDKIQQRTLDFENMNKELLKQITVHRQKEQKAAEELELFKSIITQQKDLVIRINPEGFLLYHNPSFMHIKQLHEGLKENVLNYFGEGDFPNLSVIISDFENGAQQVICEIQLKIQVLEWYNFYFSPIKNSRGLITEIQIVARNINEIKKMGQELKLQKEMLVNMLNTSDKVSFTINKMGVVEQLSQNWEHYTGVPLNKVIHHQLFDFVYHDDIKKIAPKIQELVSKNKKSCQFNFRLKYTDNSWNWQTTEMNTILDNYGEVLYFVGCFHPIKKKDLPKKTR